jgi:energy-coupling factor transporter ATP-binding protein EcfA2
MRILELEIHNVRGIKDLILKPNGENLVVWGPNGSGKSAVVDAVDFLLTGKISRLMGEGTSGLTLKAHGPHIDYSVKDASVRAVIKIPNCEKPISLTRAMSAPNVLVFPAEYKQLIDPILAVASKGQHVLSRREILKYVAAEAGKRSAEVQALLNLSELEDMRKTAGRVLNTARTELVGAESSLAAARTVVQGTLNLSSFGTDTVRATVNACRQLLGGPALTELAAESLKQGLAAPSVDLTGPKINPELLTRAETSAAKFLDSIELNIAQPDRSLRALLESLRKDQTALRAVSRLKLMELGVTQILDDGTCPLCGTHWEPGLLRTHLETHIASAKAASDRSREIQTLATKVASAASSLQSNVIQIGRAATLLAMTDDATTLNQWSQRISEFTICLSDPVSGYPGSTNTESDVAKLFAPDGVRDSCRKVVAEAKQKIAPLSPEQSAWDTLTRLKENWTQYESASARLSASKTFFARAEAFEKSFESARENVLSALFASIECRFSALYKKIHEEDEPTFASSIRPVGAGLVFEVDFYGRGKFPPLALHSEGHQDTMGLCLYLALAERLTQGIIELTILDDVVMSVDAGHRRKVCDLLGAEFPKRQFLITTHDRTWARQLSTSGVVARKNTVEFTRWSLETGPLVATEADEPSFWKKIEEETQRNDVPAAAAKLRRGAEEFFERMCDALQAKVRYRSDGRWELGDFASAAISAYKKSLKDAKTAANSWGDSTTGDRLLELESVSTQVISRSQVEQWAINENVHYSKWEEFMPEDFRPVYEAWRDLFGLYQCPRCDGMLFLSTQGQKSVAVRCKCGDRNWNLVKKGS